MITQVVEQEATKREAGAGLGALIVIGLILWAITRGKQEAGQGEGAGVVTPSVSIEKVIPIMSPGEYGGSVSPGHSIKLQTSIKNNSTKNGVNTSLPVTVKFLVYEGSFWFAHGALLRTLEITSTLAAGATATITSPNFITIAGTIDRRDVGIEVWYEGRRIASREWDDVYYVKQPVTTPSISILGISWL